MKIIKATRYNQDYKRKILNKHKNNEIIKINKIESLIINSKNLKELLLNPFSKIYNIEQKKGNLREYFTADINKKIRLLMRPTGKYPYNNIEEVELSFEEIIDDHYGEG